MPRGANRLPPFLELLYKVKPTRNTDYYQSIVLSSKQLQWSGDVALAFRALSEQMDSALALSEQTDKYKFDAKAITDRFEALLKQRAVLWDDYRRVYLATNRPKNIPHLQKSCLYFTRDFFF